MNKPKTTLYSLIFALCVSGAHADLFDFYTGVTGGIGHAFANDFSHKGYSFGTVFGIDIPIFRTEIEYNYIHGERGASTINAHAGMMNGYIKLSPTPIIKPYIGGGVGSIFAGSIAKENINASIAYQAMIGVQLDFPFLPIFTDIETRVLFAENVTPDSNFTRWDARLKLRYQF
ncbi:MAG: hypothetical protein FWG80_03560 [Alphaproteobacteria bacterium]|nr:hypothetical protein [Alphaproteobacteria bacterium]